MCAACSGRVPVSMLGLLVMWALISSEALLYARRRPRNGVTAFILLSLWTVATLVAGFVFELDAMPECGSAGVVNGRSPSPEVSMLRSRPCVGQFRSSWPLCVSGVFPGSSSRQRRSLVRQPPRTAWTRFQQIPFAGK